MVAAGVLRPLAGRAFDIAVVAAVVDIALVVIAVYVPGFEVKILLSATAGRTRQRGRPAQTLPHGATSRQNNTPT